MTYTVPFTYLRAHGVFGLTAAAGVEQWSAGFKIPTAGTTPSAAALAAFLTAVESPFRTFHAVTEVGSGNVCHLTKLTAGYVGQDGKYTGGGAQKTTERPLSPAVAGSTVGTMPFQIASVYSLRTNILRGRGSHGRIYWPALGRTWDGGAGQWGASQCQSAATAMSILIVAINAAADAQLGSNGGVSVMSNLGSGTTAKVNKVLVGRTPDTQRRRMQDVPENYQEAVLSTELDELDAIFHRPLA